MIFKKPDVISIGDSMIDTFVLVDKKEVKIINKKGIKNIQFSWGDKIPTTGFYKSVAGNAINNAIGSSRLSMRSAIYTIIGQDTGGREILHRLNKEGVGTKFINVDKDSNTNASVALVSGGERTIFVHHYDRKYVLPGLPVSKWIYLTSMAKGCSVIYKDLLNHISSNKINLSFNPGTFQLREGMDKNKKLLALTKILAFNKEEATLWTGGGGIKKMADILHKLGVEIAVITDGPKGAYVSDGQDVWYSKQFPGPRIEATGAGDSFATAFLWGIHKKMPPAEALVIASINAMRVVGKIGPIEGLATDKEIMALRNKHKSFKAKKI